MALDYLIRLRDGISGAANAATKAVSQLQQQLRGLTQTTKAAGAEFDGAAGRFRNANGQFVAGSTRSFAAAQLLADGIKAVGRAAVEVGGFLAGTVLNAAIFRERSELRLGALLGNSRLATAEWTAAIKIAEKTKFDPKEAVNALASLSEVITDSDRRRAYFGAVADAVTVTGGGNDEMGRMILAVKQSLGMGKAQGQDLLQMANAGLGKSFIYAAIAKNFGIVGKDQETINQKAEKMISSGKVSGDRWTKALFDALMSRGGGKMAGEVAEKLGSGTIEGLLSNIKGGFDTLLGMEETAEWPAIKELKGLLGDVAALFSSTSGEGSAMTQILRKMGDAIAPIFKNLREDLTSAKALLAGNSEESSKFYVALQGTVTALYYGAKGAYYLGSGIAYIVEQLIGVGEWLGITVANVYLFSERMFEAGVDLVNGLVGGIKAAAGRVYDAAAGLGRDALLAIREALKISSPSRAMRELGLFSAEGFQQGLDSGSRDVAGSARDMAGAALGAVGGGAGSPGISIAVNVSVASGAADPRAVAAELVPQIGAVLRDQVEQVMSRWALEA